MVVNKRLYILYGSRKIPTWSIPILSNLQHECHTQATQATRVRQKMRLKRTSQKLNFLMAKAISKSYTLDCNCKWPCTFPHSYA